MLQCEIHDDSLKFSRAVYATLVLIAVFMRLDWLVLLVAVLTLLGAISFSLNVFYQFHLIFIKRWLEHKSAPVKKESAELKFVAGMTAILLFIGYFWVISGQAIDAAWIYVLVVDLLIFMACLLGFCVATMMYILLRKLFVKS